MENREQLYGNIKSYEDNASSVSCGAFCGCACSCGFCLRSPRGDSEDLKSSELVKYLTDSE